MSLGAFGIDRRMLDNKDLETEKVRVVCTVSKKQQVLTEPCQPHPKNNRLP